MQRDSVTTEQRVEGRFDVTKFLEAMLVDAKYPSIFMKCCVLDEKDNKIESHKITNYTVVAATIQHKKGKGKTIVLPLESRGAAEKKTKPASVKPELPIDPVKLSQVTAEMVDATE